MWSDLWQQTQMHVFIQPYAHWQWVAPRFLVAFRERSCWGAIFLCIQFGWKITTSAVICNLFGCEKVKTGCDLAREWILWNFTTYGVSKCWRSLYAFTSVYSLWEVMGACIPNGLDVSHQQPLESIHLKTVQVTGRVVGSSSNKPENLCKTVGCWSHHPSEKLVHLDGRSLSTWAYSSSISSRHKVTVHVQNLPSKHSGDSSLSPNDPSNSLTIMSAFSGACHTRMSVWTTVTTFSQLHFSTKYTRTEEKQISAGWKSES